MAIEVDSSDVIKLIIQFLRENNLNEACEALQAESQVSLNTVSNQEKFLSDIKYGRWDVVLEIMGKLRLTSEVSFSLFEQIILEMIELRELDAAKALLRKTPSMNLLKKESPDRYLRLEHLIQRPYFDHSEVYPQGVTKEKKRHEIAAAIKKEITTVPPSRLLSLVNQALKWQQHQGLLPKGTKYDLFRGKASVEVIEEEKFPTKPHKVIKFGKDTHVETAIFSPDGQFLVSGSVDGFIEVWDFDTGKLRKDLPYQADDMLMMHDSTILCLAFSLDSELLASGTNKGEIRVWRILKGNYIRSFPTGHENAVTSIEFVRDGTQILSASFDGTIRVHGLKSGKRLKEFRGHNCQVVGATYSNDGSQVISVGSDGNVKVWDARSTSCLLTFQADQKAQSSCLGLALNPSHKESIYVCTRSPILRVLTTEGKTISLYSIKKHDIVDFVVSPKGNYVYVIGEDCILYCFSSNEDKVENVMKLHDQTVLGIVHHPHKNIIASYSVDGTMKLWKP